MRGAPQIHVTAVWFDPEPSDAGCGMPLSDHVICFDVASTFIGLLNRSCLVASYVFIAVIPIAFLQRIVSELMW